MIAYHRGRLPTNYGLSNGLMIATSLSLQRAEDLIRGTNIVVACDNSLSSTTLSGLPFFAYEALNTLSNYHFEEFSDDS